MGLVVVGLVVSSVGSVVKLGRTIGLLPFTNSLYSSAAMERESAT